MKNEKEKIYKKNKKNNAVKCILFPQIFFNLNNIPFICVSVCGIFMREGAQVF